MSDAKVNIKSSPYTPVYVSVSQYIQQITPQGPPQLVGGYPVSYIKGSSESSMKGETISNFHARKKAGELLPHTNFEKFVSVCDSWGYESLDYNNYRYWYTPSVPLGESWLRLTQSDLLSNVPEYDFLSLVQSAAAKIQGSGFDALTFLLELTKVVRMFKLLGTKLLSLAQGKPPGTPWDLWLEGRYGWRILLFDMIDLSQALHELGHGKKTRLVQRVGTGTNWKNSYTVGEGQGSFYRYKYVANDEYSINVRAGVAADIDVDSFQFNVIQTAWELIPFSFVIDWFVSVGQTLLAASFLAGVKQYTASYGYKLTLTRTVTGGPTVISPGVSNMVASAGGKAEASLEMRTPSLVSLNPAIRLNLDEYKIVDLVALVVKLLAK